MMNAETIDQSLAAAAPVAPSESLKAACLFGCRLIHAMGFAHPDFLHKAAHEWRPSMKFPLY